MLFHALAFAISLLWSGGMNLSKQVTPSTPEYCTGLGQVIITGKQTPNESDSFMLSHSSAAVCPALQNILCFCLFGAVGNLVKFEKSL